MIIYRTDVKYPNVGLIRSFLNEDELLLTFKVSEIKRLLELNLKF